MNNRRSMEFETRLILSLIVVLLITLSVVTTLTQYMTRKQETEDAVTNGILLTDNRADSLQLSLRGLSGISVGFYSNQEIQQLFRKKTLTEDEKRQIRMFLSTLIQRNPTITISNIFVELYPSACNFLVRNDGTYLNVSNVHLGFPRSVEAGDMYAFGPHPSEDYRISLGDHSRTVLTFQQEWFDSADGSPLAVVAYDVDVNDLAEIIFPEEDEPGFLGLNTSGQSAGGLILEHGRIFMDQDVAYLNDVCKTNGWGRAENRTFYGIAFRRDIQVNNLSLYMIRLVYDHEIYGNADLLLRRNVMIILLCFLLCGAAITIVSQNLLAPVRKLDAAMQEFSENGDLSYRVSPKVPYPWNDEMGRLIMRTDEMLASMERMFVRQQQLGEAQRQAETKMLQAQINPHFLYNSLQSIASRALENGQEDLFEYITLLGERMHYSMDLEKTTAELTEEFHYVESYLILQNVRFGNPVRTELALSPEAGHMVVPKMLLQPLAENAFKHGKLCRHAGTRLKLTAQIEQNILEIIMEDNGLGCAVERIEELNLILSKVSADSIDTSSGHIGLVNVCQRLQLFFDDKARMWLEPVDGGGLRVCIRVELA